MFSRRTTLGIFCFQVFFALIITIAPEKVYAAIPAPSYFLPFNGDFTDRGGNNKTTTAGTGANIFNDSVRGKVLWLTGGADAFVRIINTLSGSYTKAAWVRLGVANPAVLPNYSILAAGSIYTSNTDLFAVANGTFAGPVGVSTLKAGPRDSAPPNSNIYPVFSTGAFPTGQWMHVAVTFDATTKEYKLYQSGVAVATATGILNPVSLSQVVGAVASNTAVSPITYASNWSGWIDDVQMWDTVLTPSEIQEVMAQNWAIAAPTNVSAISITNGRVRVNWAPVSATPAVTDYMIEYKFTTGSSTSWQVYNDGVSTATGVVINTGLISPMSYDFRVSAINASGAGFASTGISAEAGVPEPQFLLRFNGNFNDSTTNNNHGTVSGGVTVVTEPIRGQVGSFDGGQNVQSASFVSVGTGIGTGGFSRAGWIQATGFGNLSAVYYFRGIFGDTSFVRLNGDTAFAAGHTASPVFDSAAFPIGTWVHVGMTFDAATTKYTIYKNGAYVASGIAGSSPAGSAATSVGKYPGLSTWLGYMDDMQQWRGVLSSGQMQAVYEGNLGLNILPPGAPTDFTGAIGGSGQAVLSWSGVTADPVVTDYQIEYKFNTGATWTVLSDGISTNTGVTITGLINNLSYDFRVSAVNSVATGTASSTITLAPSSIPEPAFFLRFEGNYMDSSANGNDGVNGGTVLINDPGRGLVARFNGTTNFVMVSAPLTSGGNFTKAAWVFAATGTTLTARNIINNANSNFFWVNNSLAGGHTNNTYVNDSATFTSGAWVHVAITFDYPTRKYNLYKNGVYAASGTAPHGPITSTGTYIGSYLGLLNFWSGYIDDAVMWNVALTPAQITAIYSGENGATPPAPSAPTNLTGVAAVSGQVRLTWSGSVAASPVTDYQIEYKFNTGVAWTVLSDGISTNTGVVVTGLFNDIVYDFRVSAVNSVGTGSASSVINVTPIDVYVPHPQFFLRFEGNYLDSSANRNNGINSGTVIVNDATRGNVARFNGTNSFVSVGASVNLAGFSKAAWVFIPTGTVVATRSIMTNANNNPSFFSVSNSLIAGHGAAGGTARVTDPVSFTLGSWVHTAMTFDGATRKYTLYKNGAYVASGIAPNLPAASTIAYIGTYNGGSHMWSGFIDDALLWDQTLTPQQIQSVYEGNPGVPTTTPWAPRNFNVRSVGSGVVHLAWSGLSTIDPVFDYQIEYKFSTGSSWTVLSDGVSTELTGSVTGLFNNIAYDFRVSAINSKGVGDGAVTSAAATSTQTYYHILSNGESLSYGLNAPVITVSQPYQNLALSGGNPQGTGNQLGLLIESGAETPSAGMANALRAYTGVLARPIIVGLHGANGGYSLLKKGTSAYAKGMAQASISKSLVEATGGIYKPIAVTIVHGESDATSVTTGYEASLVEWQRDYQFDVNAIAGTTGVLLPMFINQVNSTWSGGVAVAQLSAHKNNPGKIILVGPKYQYSYLGDKIRLASVSSKHVGEMFAKVINKVVFQGQSWNPLMPTSVVRSGSVITVSYNIPVGTLNIDTGNVVQRTNYGFEFVQSGGSTTIISGVSLVSGNTQVQIQLSGAANGTNQMLRYAWSCPTGPAAGFGACGSSTLATAVGGNIRDSDESISSAPNSTGLPLYNWSVTFEEPISSEILPPSAPTNVTAVAASGQATVSFSGSADDGGTGIIYYIATSNPGNISFTGTGSPITVTGLTNGVSYTFTVTARNSVRTGSASSGSNSVTPMSVPNAPTNVVATATSSGQVTVSFSGSTYSGSSDILYYVVTSSSGGISYTGSDSPVVLSGLINGLSYTFTVAAVNGIGTGPVSNPSNSVIPATVPNAPTNVVATASSGQAIISFSGSTYTGGSDILYYIATSSPGNISFTGTGSPITVTGLTNGTSYTFTVRAINAIGTGTASSASSSVVPATVPNAPTNVTATGGNGQATVRFSGSTNSGGSNILYYVATSNPGNISFTGGGSFIRLTGLTNGTGYTFTVVAVNAIGTGPASSVSNSIIPVSVPGVPINIIATGGNESASIWFAPPVSDGGTGIIEYLVTSSPGSFIVASGGAPIIMNGLTNGVFYTFTVMARNSVGFGAQSAASNSVLVATVPNEPTNVVAEVSSGQAIISFSGSTNSGGSNILYYVVGSNTGDFMVTGDNSPIAISGLRNGTPYIFSVAAVNAIGTGTESFIASEVVALSLPNAPTNVTAIAGNQEATIAFSGVTYDGGTGIIEYIVTSSPGNVVATGLGSPIIVPGLTNGVSYTFTVVARNGVGTGELSSGSNATIPSTIANAPTSVTAVAGNEQATISFNASTDDGGFPILYYIVRSSPGNIIATGANSPITVEGLTNGVTYTFTVVAQTSVTTGVLSAPSNSVVPVTVPGVPQNIEAAGTNGEAVFDFDPPLTSGGSAILGYRITSITGLVVATSSTSPITVTGFINGTTHTFFISAFNIQGEGASGAVTLTITTPTTAPVTAPLDIAAKAASGAAIFTFAPPLDNGGLFIDYYTIRSHTGLLVKTGTNSPIIFTGLANGVSYVFTVSAVNAQGEGPGDSVSVMPNILAAYATGMSHLTGMTSMLFNWETTIPSSTQIQYSISTGYGLQSAEGDVSPRVTTHSGSISGLFACTTYTYRFIGTDMLGSRYTGTNYSFTTLGCPNNSDIVTQEQDIIDVPVGAIFSMVADIGTILELIIPADVVASAPTLIFQGKQLDTGAAMVALGLPNPSLIQVGALYDLQAYSGDVERVTNFDTGLTLTLSYRDQDVSGVDESTLKIYSHDGTSWSELDNCVVDMVNKTVTCDTPHFSNFSIFGVPLATTPSVQSAGGGGGVYLTKDVCPNGDYSLSYYDRTCSSAGLPDLTSDILRLALAKCRALKGEEQQSYCFNRAIGSTTMPTFLQARYYDQITRAQLAKIMGEFAKNILGKLPDTSKQCVFSGEDPDGLKAYMIQACQLGLMNTSRPNDILTRGEYMTVLSRMLYGKKYEQTNVESEEHPFYEYHMEKLYSEGLINRKEPMVKAQRFVPFLTLYRLAQKLEKESR